MAAVATRAGSAAMMPGDKEISAERWATSLCSVSDCVTPARTRGLCRKHYMRNYRHGDPGIKNRTGPRRDPATAILLEQFPNQSRRTRTRFARAIQLAGLIRDYFNIEGALEDAIRHATRPNGSLNATLVLAHVEKRMAMLVASRSAAC